MSAVEEMTAEQAAAYINATSVVVLSELLAMHWQNEQYKLDTQLRLAAGMDVQMPIVLPCPPQQFQERMRRHCVLHDDVLRVFQRAIGKGGLST